MNMNELAAADLQSDITSHAASAAASPEVFQQLGAITRQLASWAAILAVPTAIAGIYGMNFDVIPLLHTSTGFWWTLGSMALIATTLAWVFWRKRYLLRSGR